MDNQTGKDHYDGLTFLLGVIILGPAVLGALFEVAYIVESLLTLF